MFHSLLTIEKERLMVRIDTGMERSHSGLTGERQERSEEEDLGELTGRKNELKMEGASLYWQFSMSGLRKDTTFQKDNLGRMDPALVKTIETERYSISALNSLKSYYWRESEFPSTSSCQRTSDIPPLRKRTLIPAWFRLESSASNSLRYSSNAAVKKEHESRIYGLTAIMGFPGVDAMERR
ncbi:hypothetical protein FCM35_KLT02113 [Carex littledalei]|uniref:Uncharacterized protein n=1 Tax=Carex littledalei TaxID=544730 RepID=A0A833R3A9_9POAL|nr:hypothetical protein FCM35_KLT02113 [Carex littledalei]